MFFDLGLVPHHLRARNGAPAQAQWLVEECERRKDPEVQGDGPRVHTLGIQNLGAWEAALWGTKPTGPQGCPGPPQDMRGWPT